MFPTPEIITYVVAHNAAAASALHDECMLGVLEYRILAYLSDHPDGVRPNQLAKILGKGPASITLAINKLADEGFVKREMPGKSSRLTAISKRGLDVARDADIVLARVHAEYFSPLPPSLRATVDVGSTVTNQPTGEGNRMRDGHFFSAYEVFHAFLTVEVLLTRSTRKFGLSLTEFRILLEMHIRDGMLLPSDAAELLLLAPSTVSYAVEKLLSGRLVTRVKVDDDKRKSAIAFTDEGREVFAKALEDVEGVFTREIRQSGRAEQDAYRDAAFIIVSTLRKRR